MKQRNVGIETAMTGRQQVKNVLLRLKRTKKLAEKSKDGPRNQKETKSTRETEKYWAETIKIKMCLRAEKISKTTISKKGQRVILMKSWTACDQPTNQRLRKRRDVTGKWRKYQTTTKKPTTELSRREEKKAWVGITGNGERENDEKKRGGKMWSEVFFFFFFFRMTTNSTFFFFAASLMSTFRRWQVLPYQCLPLMGSSHSVGT